MTQKEHAQHMAKQGHFAYMGQMGKDKIAEAEKMDNPQEEMKMTPEEMKMKMECPMCKECPMCAEMMKKK